MGATSLEASKSSVLREQALKTYVGGTDVFQCRLPFSSTMCENTPHFSCFLSTNNSVMLENDDPASRRCIMYLPLLTIFYSHRPETLFDGTELTCPQYQKDATLAARMQPHFSGCCCARLFS
jgi:hypothetical protein